MQSGELRRCNIEETKDGVRICFGEHDKSADCDWEYFVRETKVRELRAEVLEEAAAYHDAEIVRLEETIASNSAYLARMGKETDDYSNDLCRHKQEMHKMHAAAIRALKEKQDG